MLIKAQILDKILQTPALFGELLQVLGIDKPATLVRALERKSKYFRQNVNVVDYLRSKGYTDEEIFEAKTEAI